MLLEVSRPGLYLPRPASPWSSKQNSPEETLTAASQVFQNQRKRSPSPRSPPPPGGPPPPPRPRFDKAALPGLGAADTLPGLGPPLVKNGGWGWGKRVLRAPKRLWASETPSQKELKPPEARERGGICSPKGKQRCPRQPASPKPGTSNKSWSRKRRGERQSTGLTGALCPLQEPRKGVPPSPPTLEAYTLLLKEAKEV